MSKVSKMKSDAKAIFVYLQQNAKRKKRKGPIKVGFMCQYIPSWNNVKSVYEAMVQDERFDPVIICVPSRISDYNLIDLASEDNDTYTYYVNHGYEAVNALIGKNEWLDIASLQLDYIFFLRPYDFYMPKQYAPAVLARYSKVCLILYGMCLTEEFARDLLFEGFMRYVYCFFADDEFEKKMNEKSFPLAHLMGLQKSVLLGVPSMKAVMEMKDSETDIYAFAKDAYKIMWTPRWTTDKKLGGTNFFTYKDWILNYIEDNPGTACLIRPHPLAFDNFIQTGEMTAEEVADYKARICDIKNAALDTGKEYTATLWNSDVLISDISGIIPEFFVTGKPVIFCSSNFTHTLTDLTKHMFEGCYIAKSVDELKGYLDMLRNGEDPKKSERERIIEELFDDSCRNSVSKILDMLSVR